jgi:NADPH-dependent 2,4-dienoyl-CoA reductase/sulfur reductase-like enzyme/rhodanese-related sulfurtransferase
MSAQVKPSKKEGFIARALNSVERVGNALPMKIIIVGGVAGGASAAARLRRNDEHAEIILVEKGEYISFANCGLPYYIGGTIPEKEALLLQTPESFYARFRVDVRVLQEVVAVDTVAKTVQVKNHRTGEVYTESYDKLVLSPGASPIRPGLPGAEKNHVFTLRNIPDTYAIREHIDTHKPRSCAVIGAGFIGMEMAENLAQLGLSVNIIEAAPHVMAPIDLDMAHEVHNYIRSKGLGLYLGQKCTGFTEHSVLLDSGASVPADMVMMSIGVAPETGFLKESGIQLGSRGEILVNEWMQTSAKDVYAVGDAVAVQNLVSGKSALIPLASPANKQGRLVADHICGKNRSYKGSQGTSILKFFDLTVAVTGEKEENLKAAGIPYRKSYTYSGSHAGYYPGATTMAIKLLFEENGRILGAQIVGYDGVDKRIDSLANAIRFGLSVYDLQEMELAYAPPFSSAKDPVNMAGYVAGNILDSMMVPFYVEDIPGIPSDALCIDVRNEEEYGAGHIKGFDNIPLDCLREHLPRLDLTKKIYVNCQVGLRGYIAQRILTQHGAKVWNLSGGYRLYKAKLEDQQHGIAEPANCMPCGKELER